MFLIQIKRWRLSPPALTTGARLHAEVRKALATPPMRERLAQLGLAPIGNAPAEFKPFVAAQVKIIAEIVRSAGIAPD